MLLTFCTSIQSGSEVCMCTLISATRTSESILDKRKLKPPWAAIETISYSQWMTMTTTGRAIVPHWNKFIIWIIGSFVYLFVLGQFSSMEFWCCVTYKTATTTTATPKRSSSITAFWHVLKGGTSIISIIEKLKYILYTMCDVHCTMYIHTKTAWTFLDYPIKMALQCAVNTVLQIFSPFQ